jgi:hypothetical protein
MSRDMLNSEQKIPLHMNHVLDETRGQRFPLSVLVLFLLVHGLLLWFDISNPQAFFQGDRAKGRYSKIQYLYCTEHSTASYTSRLLEQGDPGDYVIHGALYCLGGPYLVIVFQIVLNFFAVFGLYKIASLLYLRRRYCIICAVSYMLLPGSLMQPHTLVTEGIFNSLVIYSLYFMLQVMEKEFRRSAFIFASLFMGLAIMVRFQLVLFPVLFAAIFCCYYRNECLKRVTLIAMVSFAPLVGWLVFVYTQTGQLGLGPSDHSLGFNFFIRVVRMSKIGGFVFDPSLYINKQMPLLDFVWYVYEHPISYLRTLFYGIVNLLFNPGVNHFAGHYLGVLDTAEKWGYWSDLRDRDGLASMLADVANWGPLFIAVFVGATVVWLVFLATSAVGAWLFLKDRRINWATKSILMSFFVYGLLIVPLVGGGSRWTHRTPIEFIMAMFIAMAVDWYSNLRSRVLVE